MYIYIYTSQVPTPHNHTPHLLVWSSSHCSLTISVTFDLLETLDKLCVLYTPLLLPWVTAVFIAGNGWSFGVELCIITVLYGLTRYVECVMCVIREGIPSPPVLAFSRILTGSCSPSHVRGVGGAHYLSI